MKEIKYNKVGDYYFPELDAPQNITGLSLFGRRLYEHMQKHERNKLFALQCENQLQSYLENADKKMNEQYDLLIGQLTKSRGITEDLKVNDQIRWVQEMNTVKYNAMEMVMNDYISF